jgi:hypothetical protein
MVENPYVGSRENSALVIHLDSILWTLALPSVGGMRPAMTVAVVFSRRHLHVFPSLLQVGTAVETPVDRLRGTCEAAPSPSPSVLTVQRLGKVSLGGQRVTSILTNVMYNHCRRSYPCRFYFFKNVYELVSYIYSSLARVLSN